MAEHADPAFTSIADVSARLRDGRVSPVALLDHCLARIERLDPHLNAFITVTADLAREQARVSERELSQGHWRGPLHGVPVAVKDFYDTAGVRTTAAFEPFANRVPRVDAEMVVRLRDAGAVLVGKTNMHTLGKGTTSLESHFGPVVNPWSASHVAGGSSGGSAVAVSAGLCFATVDTDAVGSGRLPAAICGVSCLKPTYGVLSAGGILAGEPVDPAIVLLSHPSVMARSAQDLALAFHAVTPSSANKPAPIRRLGIVTNFAGSDHVRGAFVAAIEPLRAMPIETREVRVPFEAASFDVSRIERDRAAINLSLFRDVDAIVLPTLTGPAPTLDDARALGPLAVAPDNTFFCNYFGLPAMCVPAAMDAEGLPFGLQFVGPLGDDDRILTIAVQYQQTTEWVYQPPPLASGFA